MPSASPSALVDIVFEECRPQYLLGYGEVPASAVPELHGLVDELQGIVARLDAFLAQRPDHDVHDRLHRLAPSGDVEHVQQLARIINEHGLVEFRPTLSMLVERLEGHTFEIAVFGRVSSGKSSLLNCIVQSPVLPVGVNPVTAVPTRLMYGPEPRGTAWFVDKSPELFALERLPELVTEQGNPANSKHVTRIVVALPSPATASAEGAQLNGRPFPATASAEGGQFNGPPSPRLRPGVVFVDTPGLGSLATSGAVETMAYLPHCDLGVVLIDAGSTLLPEDLATLQSLSDAGIPALVLLSKADLLEPADRERVLQYIADHIAAALGVRLHVRPVSIKPGHLELLEQWFTEEILPLYDRHVALSHTSLQRKVGALTEAVATALRVRLTHASRISQREASHGQDLEKTLRQMAGRFAAIRQQSREVSDTLRAYGDVALTEVASTLIDRWQAGHGAGQITGAMVTDILCRVTAAQAAPLASACTELAREAAQILQHTAQALGFHDAPGARDMLVEVQEMPWLDLGRLEVHLRPSAFRRHVSTGWAVRQLAGKLRRHVGAQVVKAFAAYGRLLEAWSAQTLTDVQRRFDASADAYRAHLGRLATSTGASLAEQEALRKDLEALLGPEGDATTAGMAL